MKRVRESGAAYRKKRLQREENIKKNEGALLKFIKCSEVSSSTSMVSQTCHEGDENILTTEDENAVSQIEKERRNTPTLPSNSNISDLDDIGNWPEKVSDGVRSTLVSRGVEAFQNINANFAEVSRKNSKGEIRRLTRDWFYRTLTNGEKILRSWMVYSPSKGSLFCFCCRLFPNTSNESKFSSPSGFNEWWKLNPKVGQHESSTAHFQSYGQWKELELRIRKGLVIDKIEQEEIEKQMKKWQEILLRLVDIIKFLAKQNLAFLGHREDESSFNRGNFLELVHLIGKYDPVLREHLVRIKMGQQITYLSPQIQNEFIEILGNNVRQKILENVKNAKYYSIIFDSTPDIAHKDQTSQVLRYVSIENQEVKVVESFIDFIETSNKDAENISNMILSKLKADGLNVMDCRGQSYDNAAVMAGKHSGVQKRIKDINPKAVFIPCSNHSLNLVCLHAAAVESNSVTFFGTLERCYSFFSMSTHRWEVLLETAGKTLKRLQDTRWSARADAVNMTWHHYKNILSSLDKLTEADESMNTRTDGGILIVAMQSYSFLCFLGMWKPVLNEIDDTQKYLQSEGLNVLQCARRIKALKILLTTNRQKFINDAFSFAKNLCEDLGIPMEAPRRISKKHIFGDGSREPALSYIEELRRKLFSSFDKITVEVSERFEQLQNIADKFYFLTPEKLLDVDYVCSFDDISDDIDSSEFELERVRLRSFINAAGEINKLMSSNVIELLHFILSYKLEESMPNIVIVMRIFLTIAISNASCERSFSKLKLIKNYLRSSMSSLRLNNLAILAIEQEETEKINIESIINNFAMMKSRIVKF